MMPVRHVDDFVIVRIPPKTGLLRRSLAPFALTGPGLAAEGIPFESVTQAVERGEIIARNSRASLWDATGPAPLLVATFRR